jgi:hypothetical protein
MRLEGGCYCGQVRFVAEGEPMMKAQCHCRECRFFTGGGPNYVIGMPKAGFSYVKGEPARYARADLELPASREFCANCGTPLGTQAAGFPGMIIKVGVLDDPSVFEGPQVAVNLIDKLPFHHIPEGVPTFERFPG